MTRGGKAAGVLMACALAAGGCGGDGATAPAPDEDGGTDTSPPDTDSWPTGLPDGGAPGIAAPECSHLGEWEWAKIRGGEDCGPGCTQLTFTKSYVKYDMWDVGPRYLAYVPYAGGLHVIDLEEMLDLDVPPPEEGVVYGNWDAWPHYPVVDGDVILYGYSNWHEEPGFRGLYRVDPAHLCQTALFLDAAQWGEHQEPFHNGDLLGNLYVASTDISGLFSDDVNDLYNEPFDIAAFDLRFPFAGLSALVADLPQFGYASPQLSSGDVVWMWFSESSAWLDIFRYDMSTGETSILVGGDGVRVDLSVGQGRAVYSLLPHASAWDPTYGYDDLSGADVWLYDLESGESVNLTDDAFIQLEPDVHGNRVAYVDFSLSPDPLGPYPKGGGDIHVLDIPTGERLRASFLPDRVKGAVELHGDRVFFVMLDAHRNEQLYMIDLAVLGI